MAARPSTRTATTTAPAPAPPLDPESPDPSDTTDPKDKLDFFDYLRSLDRGFLANSMIYLYRLEPKIKNKADRAYIDKFAAEGVDEEFIKQKHGGGKFQAWLNTPDPVKDVKRVFWIDAPAIIRPDQILVDEKGDPLPAAPAAPAADPISKSDLVQTLQTVLEAVKNKDVTAGQALGDMMSLMKQAAAGAVDIATSSAKQQATNPGGGLEAVVRELLQELKASRQQQPSGNSRLDKLIDLALEKMLNPAPPPDMFEQLKKLADLGSMDGLGFLKNLLGGADKESFWEKAGGMLAEGLASAIKENGPAIVQAYREKLQVDHARIVLQSRAAGNAPPAGPAGPPPAPAPGPPPPLPNLIRMPAPPAAPAAPPAAAAPAPQPQPPQQPMSAEEQAMASLQLQITNLIRTCWDESDSGHDTAVTVKRAFKPLVAFLRAQFNDLEKLKEMAKADPVLGDITADPEFPEFAKEFFEELHAADPQPGPEPTPAA